MKPKPGPGAKPDYVGLLKSWVGGMDRKELIQNGVMAGAFAVFILFFFLPSLSRNRKTSQEVVQLNAQIRNANAVIAKLPKMKEQKAIFGSRIDKIRTQFFTPDEAKQLIEIISKAASQSKVHILATQPSGKEATFPEPFQQMYRAASYELTVEGGYHNLGLFVNELERYPKNFSISEFKVAGSKENPPGVHKAVLVLNAFLERFVTVPK